MRFLTSWGFSRTSNPATVAVPAVGGRKQVRTRMVVVLPAPLGPRKPTIWPFSTSKEMLSDRKSTRLNSSHLGISYAVFCLKKKKRYIDHTYFPPQADIPYSVRLALNWT